MDGSWNIFGYIAFITALIYRIPQILKMYRTKKSNDVSAKMFILQSISCLFFIIYLAGSKNIDILLISYYSIGIFLNIIVCAMKRFYKNDTE
jgi:uncharacterized protein with PQ loop repeat